MAWLYVPAAVVSSRGYAVSGEDLLLADGFDAAFVGVGRRSSRPDVAVYDVAKMVEVLTVANGMPFEDAVEYLEFNVFGAWVGEQTPIYLERTTVEAIRASEGIPWPS